MTGQPPIAVEWGGAECGTIASGAGATVGRFEVRPLISLALLPPNSVDSISPGIIGFDGMMFLTTNS